MSTLLVNADRLGSTAFVRILRASNTTAGAGKMGATSSPEAHLQMLSEN
jgi:hypothetical protein